MEPPARYTGLLFRRVQQAHVAVWQREVSAEVTSVQFGVLDALSQSPGASQRELCVRLDLDRSTIAEIVARLERRKLISRGRDASDLRTNRLLLTEAGKREHRELVPRVARVDSVLTGMLDEGDRDVLRRILTVILASDDVRAALGPR